MPHKLIARFSCLPDGFLVDVPVAPVPVERIKAVSDSLQNRSALPFSLPLFANVPKNQDGADDEPVRAEYRSGAVIDRYGRTVSANQSRVVREGYNHSLAQHSFGRVLYRLSADFVHGLEDLLQR